MKMEEICKLLENKTDAEKILILKKKRIELINQIHFEQQTLDKIDYLLCSLKEKKTF